MFQTQAKTKTKTIAVVAMAAGLLGAAFGTAVARGTLASESEPLASESSLPTIDLGPGLPADGSSEPTTVIRGRTPDGRTYGTTPVPQQGQSGQSVDEGPLPDLVAVIGDHGKEGYVVSADLEAEPEVGNPEEALAYMAELKKRGPIRLPVYSDDGVTVVDTFTIGTPAHSD